LFDEGRFSEPSGGNCFVSLRLGTQQCDRCRPIPMNAVADAALRQYGFLFLEFCGWIVAALDIGPAETGELDGLPARGEHGRLASRALRRDLETGPPHTCVHHLYRKCSL